MLKSWRMISLRRRQRSAPSHWDWRLESGVGCGCDIGICGQGVAASLCQNGDFGGWECGQNVLKSFQTCGVVWCGAKFKLQPSHDMILSIFAAGAVLCAGFEVWRYDSRGRRRES